MYFIEIIRNDEINLFTLRGRQMTLMVSSITSQSGVCLKVCSDRQQRSINGLRYCTFVRGIHRRLVDDMNQSVVTGCGCIVCHLWITTTDGASDRWWPVTKTDFPSHLRNKWQYQRTTYDNAFCHGIIFIATPCTYVLWSLTLPITNHNFVIQLRRNVFLHHCRVWFSFRVAFIPYLGSANLIPSGRLLIGKYEGGDNAQWISMNLMAATPVQRGQCDMNVRNLWV